MDGLDGAGKGEAVARLYGWMDARHLICNAYGEPMDEARLRPPLWRYWRDLPARGDTAIVFGSWYQSVLRDWIFRQDRRRCLRKRRSPVSSGLRKCLPTKMC
ncbi:hypothetical protein QW131_25300 [Roseibium salinum]|nr:hypothetical protein [Roseibium salinum]